MDFDQHSAGYSQEVDQALSVVGLRHDFFLEAKVEHIVEARMRLAGVSEPRTLEIGCGVGLLQRRLRPLFKHLFGIDSSIASLGRAPREERLAAADGVHLPFADESFDLVIAVCVLHHVPVAQRAAFLGEMARVTRPGGLITICEHNPWNPLTRLVVARCEFDNDAVLLPAAETRRRLCAAGLTEVRSRFILFFPWQGALWRRLERLLASLPLGGQYFVEGSRR
ncbi:MAG: methyltransferase domain-containing protein [Acidobacteriota bacterium]